MRRAARAIIIKGDNLLVMYRNKFGHEYYTLPGGGVEPGEDPADTVLREVMEETTVRAVGPRLVFIEHAEVIYGDQLIYVCDYVSGEPSLHPMSIEREIHNMGKNLYEPIWLPLHELPAVPFLSRQLQAALLDGIYHGWPEQPREFTSTRTV